MQILKSSSVSNKKFYTNFKKLLVFFSLYKSKYILIIPENARFGNHLYFYLHAYRQRLNGVNLYIHHHENMDYWLDYFPDLREFVILKNQIKKLDFKIKPTSFYQNHHIDFTNTDLNSFISKYLDCKELQSKSYIYDLVINIRRGDFYTPGHIEMYGFNQEEYIKNALLKMDFQLIKTIAVVSDDINWCKINLSFLNEYGNELIYQDNDPITNFLTLINAKNMILANSTFTYWSAYINENRGAASKILAPNFNAHHVHTGKPVQASPKWELIDVT